MWISGPTGSGKSTLANTLELRGFSVVREELPTDMLRLLAENPQKHCGPIQSEIMRSRIRQFRNLRGARRIVFDRSIDEDIEVFTTMHYRNGLVSASEFDALGVLASQFREEVGDPDLVVYLNPSREVLNERLKVGDHSRIILDHVDQQLALYASWVEARKNRLVAIDNSYCTVESFGLLLGESYD